MSDKQIRQIVDGGIPHALEADVLMEMLAVLRDIRQELEEWRKALRPAPQAERKEQP